MNMKLEKLYVNIRTKKITVCLYLHSSLKSRTKMWCVRINLMCGTSISDRVWGESARADIFFFQIFLLPCINGHWLTGSMCTRIWVELIFLWIHFTSWVYMRRSFNQNPLESDATRHWKRKEMKVNDTARARSLALSLLAPFFYTIWYVRYKNLFLLSVCVCHTDARNLYGNNNNSITPNVILNLIVLMASFFLFLGVTTASLISSRILTTTSSFIYFLLLFVLFKEIDLNSKSAVMVLAFQSSSVVSLESLCCLCLG